MSTVGQTFDNYSAITLNAYFHLKAACIQLDMIVSERKMFKNQDFIKQILKTRKESRILITEIEKAYQDAGIPISEIEKENEAIAEAADIMAKVTDQLQIKPIVRVKF